MKLSEKKRKAYWESISEIKSTIPMQMQNILGLFQNEVELSKSDMQAWSGFVDTAIHTVNKLSDIRKEVMSLFAESRNDFHAVAGIGSRELTENDKIAIRKATSYLIKHGYVIYSGNASGADIEFQTASEGNCVVFLPWNNFNVKEFDYNNSDLCMASYVTGRDAKARVESLAVHPHGETIKKESVKAIHTRNYHQIHGHGTLPAVKFVVCCADPSDTDGGVAGGTGQPVRIAEKAGIPVVNLRQKGWVKVLKALCEKESS